MVFEAHKREKNDFYLLMVSTERYSRQEHQVSLFLLKTLTNTLIPKKINENVWGCLFVCLFFINIVPGCLTLDTYIHVDMHIFLHN